MGYSIFVQYFGDIDKAYYNEFFTPKCKMKGIKSK